MNKKIKNRDDNNSFSKKQKNENRQTCFCGKECKKFRGLQTHKRACNGTKLPDTVSLYDSSPLSENVPVAGVSFDVIIL